MHNSTDLTARKWTTRTVNPEERSIRLLVVDDDINGADALAAYLSCENFSCRVAYGGRESFRSAVVWIPDLILMDISMPECNGFEASRRLRRDARTSEITMVAHTSLDELEVRRHMSDDEFDGYCQKGQSLESLVLLIRSFAPWYGKSDAD